MVIVPDIENFLCINGDLRKCHTPSCLEIPPAEPPLSQHHNYIFPTTPPSFRMAPRWEATSPPPKQGEISFCLGEGRGERNEKINASCDSSTRTTLISRLHRPEEANISNSSFLYVLIWFVPRSFFCIYSLPAASFILRCSYGCPEFAGLLLLVVSCVYICVSVFFSFVRSV